MVIVGICQSTPCGQWRSANHQPELRRDEVCQGWANPLISTRVLHPSRLIGGRHQDLEGADHLELARLKIVIPRPALARNIDFIQF